MKNRHVSHSVAQRCESVFRREMIGLQLNPKNPRHRFVYYKAKLYQLCNHPRHRGHGKRCPAP